MTDGTCPIARSSAWGRLGASALIFVSVLSSQLALGQTIIPADRNFAWNPGMMSKGGIPSRTTICATLSPSGGDDSTAIQAAVTACPANQVVMLGAGTFIVNNYVQVPSNITLRGSGAGVTILTKTNGAKPRTATVVPGTLTTGGPLNNKIFAPLSNAVPSDSQPIIIVGNARWPAPDSTTSQNLTADGVQGAFSVTIANAANFAAGQWVLLDEITKWSLVATPPGFSPAGTKAKAGDHVVLQMHNPTQAGDDPPDAFGWFSRGYPSNASAPSDTDGRMTTEIKEIASVSGNTITFTTPLSIGYRVSHLAQLTRYTANSNGGNGATQVVNAGVENLTMVGGSDGGLRFEVTAYCWAKNVEVTQWYGEGVAINNSFRVELRDSYLHTATDPTPGGQGYAISLANGSSEILIENNISRDTNKVMVSRASGAGSVVAYNYMDDGWISFQPVWQEIGLNASHMAGNHHVLFEGNYGFNMDTDYTHGSSQYITYFRNYVTGQRGSWTGPDQSSRTAGVSSWAKEFTFIGNVLGRPGQMAGWLYDDQMMGCDATGGNCVGGVAGSWGNATGNIWQVGYDATDQWLQQAEPGALSTVIRDGNYDFLTNTQRWHNTPGGFTIPNSMYLTSAPAFFGSNPWPWVDPSTGAIYTLPAKARYDAGTPNQVPNPNTVNPVNFTVALSALPSAGGTVAGGGTFASGSSDTVTAAPNNGYTFANWTENGTVVSTAASYTFTLNGNRNLTANFTSNPTSPNLVSYTVAASASPTASGTVTGAGTFASGSSQTVTATPNSGYTFANWTANGSIVSTSASYTFTLNSNVTLLANFIPVPAATSISLGETTVFSGQDGGNGNLLLVQDATLSQAATLKNLSFNVNVAAGSLRLGIYDATGPHGGPGALKAQTASFTPVVGWNTRGVTTPVSLPPGKYWLAYFPSSSTLQFPVNFSIGSWKAAYLRFGPMPAKFPAVSLQGTTHWSLYGTLQ